jgi:mono/diheme cytochrome c family protein
MFSMRKTLCCGLGVLLFGFTAIADETKATPKKAAAGSDVEHGRYLVEYVAGCPDCHTPRLENGEFDKTRWLKGAMLDFQPIHPIPHWKAASPDITPSGPKWTRWGEAGFVRFLETGAWPDGDKADPPMPAYRLHARDAKAVGDYLKTLK